MARNIRELFEYPRRTRRAPPVIDGGNRRITGGAPPDNRAKIARSPRGRFVPGTAAGDATRFQKGRSGNPTGRPKGSFRVGTRAAAALLDAHGEALAQRAIEMALSGDAVAVRFCLGRLLGLKRGQPIELDLPEIGAADDLAEAVAAVSAAVADGRLTPDEALALARMLDRFPHVLAAAAPAPELAPEYEEEDERDPRKVLAERLNRLARGMAREGEPALSETLQQMAAGALESEPDADPDGAAGFETWRGIGQN
jgi:hypothetical protein